MLNGKYHFPQKVDKEERIQYVEANSLATLLVSSTYDTILMHLSY